MTQKKSIAQVEAETQDEIAEIMSEIESLQTEMAEAPHTAAQPKSSSRLIAVSPAAPAAAEPEVGLEDFHGTGDEPSLEETLGALGTEKQEESTGQSLLDVPPTPYDEDEVEAAVGGVPNEERSMDSRDGCLSMTLSGQMTLKLKYEFEGQEVTIGFSDGALKVELSDGTEFKIPVARHSRAA